MPTVLILDDEPVIRDVLGSVLAKAGFVTREAATAAEGLERLAKEPIDLLLLDLMLPDRPGLEVLSEVKSRHPEVPVVVVTAYSSVESAITAMREGAFHYLPKPFRNEEVVHVVKQALEKKRLVAENRALKARLNAPPGLKEIIGRSPSMERVFETIRQAAPARSTILITGESGTGKELVAKALHRLSPRASGPFVTVHSGALPPDLLESNLFGHVRGSFTGAIADKKGLFKAADQGTIFFDEIGNVPLETQAKLLRVIQEREFMRLGGMETIKVDVRIIAATNVDLRQMMEEGRFREDLFYRLHVISIQLPPLRDRKDDIPLLVHHFLDKYGEENRKVGLEVMPEALDVLMDYDWAGNVREIENVIERAVVLCTGPTIGVDLIPDHVRKAPNFSMPQINLPPEGISFKEVITDFEKRLIESTLEAAGGVQKRAAELLHIKPTTLNEMIKRYDIRPRRKRQANGVEPAEAPAAERAGTTTPTRAQPANRVVRE